MEFGVTYPDITGKPVTITDASTLFTPGKSPILDVKLTTANDEVEFWKTVMFWNSDFIFDQISRRNKFAERWINMFQREVPKSDWYILGMMSTEFNESSVNISYYDDFVQDTKSQKISETAEKVFNKLRNTNWSLQKSGTNSNINIFKEIVQYLRGKLKFKTNLGKLLDLEEIREIVTETNNTVVVLISDADQQYWFKEGKIQMSLSYANRSELYKVFQYSTNIIQVVGDRNWNKPGENQTLYGLELEVCTDYEVQHIIDSFPEIYAICKQDSTISGTKTNKMEIVSIPATLRTHKRNIMAMFKNLNEDMFDTLDKHTNGMHIHVDRKAFDEDLQHLKKFCFFFTNPANSQFLMEISERDKSSLDLYSKIVKSKSVIDAEKNLRNDPRGKHVSVNLGKGPTVEVRLFKGIVAQGAIIKNLEFVDSVVEFTKNTGFSNLNLRDYISFMDKQPRRRWAHLRDCLSDLNLIDMIAMADFEALFGSESSPKNACDKLNNMKPVLTTAMGKKIVSMFNQAYQANGTKLIYNPTANPMFSLLREGTKFAKHNDKLMKWYGNYAA